MKKTICAMGIDITKEYMQISCQEHPGAEPVSVSVSNDEKKYLIPSVVYYRKENDTWYIGDEALFNSNSDKRECYRFEKNIKNDITLLSRLIEGLIELGKKAADFENVEIICVAVSDCDLSITKNIFEAFSMLGYDEDKIRVINHDEAFVYYTINQKKELWTNDVALFDFTGSQLKYRRIHEIKGKNPPVLSVIKEDLSNDIYGELLETDSGRRRADSSMLEYIQQEFKKNIVCTVFLTGEGFYDDWYEESLKEMLGSRRRVFKGYNLFVKGACYAALKKYQGVTEKKHIFQCSGRTGADIGLLINNQGKNMVISLSQAGTNWYEAGAKAECILDNVTKINIVVVSAIDGASKNQTIDLSGFPERPNKTTRVRIVLAYEDDDTFNIVVEDMGFGEIFNSSGKRVKKTISISELFSI